MHPMRNLEHKVPFLQGAERCVLEPHDRTDGWHEAFWIRYDSPPPILILRTGYVPTRAGMPTVDQANADA